MEQLSAAELIEVTTILMSSADTQFQYWITVTFASVVAAFVAGDRLTTRLRLAATVLYSLASFVLIYRFFDAMRAVFAPNTLLVEQGIEIPGGSDWILLIPRVAVFALGTGAAIYVLVKGTK